MRLVILTEERSMEEFLRGLLPRILPIGCVLDVNCTIHSHSGKSDLCKSIPLKMKVYAHRNEDVRVLIIHDQDSNDCLQLKENLKKLCHPKVPSMIRIACRELENWYLGDFDAIESVFPEIKSKKYAEKAKYRITDNLTGSEELKLLSKQFSKIQAAREIGKCISFENNRSVSFNQFVKGLQHLLSN